MQTAVQSVLDHTECLELLVADGGSTDGTLSALEKMAADDPRLRIISRTDSGPADALNKAFQSARGTLIGWLNADDLMPAGALSRAVAALEAHPNWLMVYGEGEEFNDETGLVQRYPTLPETVGIDGFRSHCFICQPTVVFRRTMGLLLGPFDEHWKTSFDFDYWLRAFDAFPSRIGYLPHLQGRTRLHVDTITNKQRSEVALEATELFARHFGSAPATHLHNLGIELQLGIAVTKPGQTHTELLAEAAKQASSWIEPKALDTFRHDWHLNVDHTYKSNKNISLESKPLSKHTLLERLLMAEHPILHPRAPGSPFDQEKRLKTREKCKASQTAEPFLDFSQTHLSNRPFGVNLIGHAFDVFGIGEDVRMAARALKAAGVPCCVVNHPAGNGAPSTDRSIEPLVCNDPKGGPYAFNLICLAAPIQARWLRESGFDLVNQRYNISAWPWETRQWPDAWLPLLEVVNEVWPSSTFTAKALQEPAAEKGVQLNVMSMAAEIPEPARFCSASRRQETRNNLSLPKDDVVFVYSFDLNSTTTRKNPMAALEAFQQAFPMPHLLASKGKFLNMHRLSTRVSLLIKTFPPKQSSPEWNWLKLRAQEDQRIHILETSLERDDLLAMYGSCDVFLSLHRSEGFGRGMAEALQLGLDVIATDYGGNTDFCNGPLSHPVRFREGLIPRGAYPYANGHQWAEPDLDHAVELCRKIAERRLSINPDQFHTESVHYAEAVATYRKYFSFSTAGERYSKRLKSLWSKYVGPTLTN